MLKEEKKEKKALTKKGGGCYNKSCPLREKDGQEEKRTMTTEQ